MKKNGFTLIELLCSIALLGLVLLIGIYATNGALDTAILRLRNVNDNEVFSAAKSYVVENNISFKSGYTCVLVKDLIDYGYLKDTNDSKIRNKTVKLIINNKTKTISKTMYVDTCN